jgi:hypothetical protein
MPETARLKALMWEIFRVKNWLIDGRVIYAHRHAKAIIGQFPSELDAIKRSNQIHRMVSRIRHGEIIDAYNDAQSLHDYLKAAISAPLTDNGEK